MARPREFDREDVLEEAIKVFADHGFGGTSTDVLLKAMGISRQSMYDTFGGKRQLYLEALQFQSRYRLSWYDSLIVAAAIQAQCQILMTEDLQHGQKFADLRVENPFLSHAS